MTTQRYTAEQMREMASCMLATDNCLPSVNDCTHAAAMLLQAAEDMTPEQLEAGRSAFEKATGSWLSFAVDRDGNYMNFTTQACLETWQAARSQSQRQVSDKEVERVIAKVELETNIDGMDGDSWDRLLVRAALESLAPAQPSVLVGRLKKILSAMDEATGDSDPNIDSDMTDDEVRQQFPDIWAMQQLSKLIAAHDSKGGVI